MKHLKCIFLLFWAVQITAFAQTTPSQMYEIGEDYFMGRNGKTQDYAKAVEWYRKSAEQGYAQGQYCLGNMYHQGLGVIEDYKEAFKWFSKAAEQGYDKAQTMLGYMYFMGEGVENDFIKAFTWEQKAAEQGNADAQYVLGMMFEIGNGVTNGRAEAIKWYEKAAEQGHQYAIERLKKLNDESDDDYLSNPDDSSMDDDIDVVGIDSGDDVDVNMDDDGTGVRDDISVKK